MATVDFDHEDCDPAPSVECRWDEPGGPRRMTFTLVRSEPALIEGYSRYEVEVSWVQRGAETLKRVHVTAETGGKALERCVLGLVATVGPLRTQWGTGPGL